MSLDTRWVCETARGKRRCHAAFDTPTTTRATKAISADVQRWQAFMETYPARYRAWELVWYAEAAALALEDHIAYMAGEDALTFCRRCAYLWDEKGVRLCRGCRDGWHRHEEEACRACATGATWVLCRACGRHRHLDGYPTCWACHQEGVEAAPDAPTRDGEGAGGVSQEDPAPVLPG